MTVPSCLYARARFGGAAWPPERAITPTRMALWTFRELQTLRRTLLRRAVHETGATPEQP